MIKKLLLPLLALAILTSACNKDDDGEDTQAPVITINKPSSGSVTKRGDDLELRATVTDNKELLTIEIAVSSGGSEVFSWNDLYGGTSATVDTTYKVNVPAHTDLLVKVKASDKAGNKSEQISSVHVEM